MNSTDLLEDEDVRRWYENMRRDSSLTATEKLRVLARLCRMMKTTPHGIVDTVREGNGFTDAFEDFLEAQRKAGRRPGYLANYLKAVKSWLDRFGLNLGRKVRVGDTTATPTLEDEKVPTRQQLRDLLMAADLRERVSISFVAFSGLRPHALGDFKGMEGLRLGDLEDLKIDDGRVTFTKTPALIRVRPSISKAKHQYLTFLGEDGCRYLTAYLQERMKGGEELTKDSPVIRCAPGFEALGRRAVSQNQGSLFIVTGNIRRGIKQAMEKAMIDARPYVLRRYFEMRLFNASWEGVVPRDWITFWAGHKGDIEHVYTLHKGLPDSLMEKMRATYAKAEPYLSTSPRARPDPRIVVETMVSGEQVHVGIDQPLEELKEKSDQEKLRAFIVQALDQDEVLMDAIAARVMSRMNKRL